MAPGERFTIASRDASVRAGSAVLAIFAAIIIWVAVQRVGLHSRSIPVVVAGLLFMTVGLAGLLLRPDGVTVTNTDVVIQDRLTRRILARSDIVDVEVRQTGRRAAVHVVTAGDSIELKHTRLWVDLQGDTMAGGRSTSLLDRLAADLREALFHAED